MKRANRSQVRLALCFMFCFDLCFVLPQIRGKFTPVRVCPAKLQNLGQVVSSVTPELSALPRNPGAATAAEPYLLPRTRSALPYSPPDARSQRRAPHRRPTPSATYTRWRSQHRKPQRPPRIARMPPMMSTLALLFPIRTNMCFGMAFIRLRRFII